MDIRAAEISDIIRKQIENYDQKVSVTETGTVLTAGDGIARVYGLSGAMAGELLEFEGAGGETVSGMVLNLEEDNVGVALLGKFESVREGDVVRHPAYRRGAGRRGVARPRRQRGGRSHRRRQADH